LIDTTIVPVWAAVVWVTAPVAAKGAVAALPAAAALTCDMTQYKSSAGVAAAIAQNVLTIAWPGQNGSEMRARYAIEGGQPIVRELSVRKTGGPWVTLGQNLTPEYH